VRASLHFGEYLSHSSALSDGVTGNDINIAARLLDSNDLRRIIRRQSWNRPLAYLLSEEYYGKIVREQVPELADRYTKIKVASKDRSLTAWLPFEQQPKHPRLSANASDASSKRSKRLRRPRRADGGRSQLLDSTRHVLATFMNEMDHLWENELDEAWVVVHKLDYHTEQNIVVLVDEFFQEYHRVFDALVRQKRSMTALIKISDGALTQAHQRAARIWELVVDAKMTDVEKDHLAPGNKEVSEVYRRAKKISDVKEKLVALRSVYSGIEKCLKAERAA
jgi:hypothetical protein